MTVREMLIKGIIQEEEAYACFPSLDYSPSLADAEKRLARRIPISRVTQEYRTEAHYEFPVLLSIEERTKYAKLGGAIPFVEGITSTIAGQTLSEVVKAVTPSPTVTPEEKRRETPAPASGYSDPEKYAEEKREKEEEERFKLKLYSIQELVDLGYITMEEALFYFGNLKMKVDVAEAESVLGRKLHVLSDVNIAVTEEKPETVIPGEKTDWLKIAVPIGIALLMIL